MQRRLFLEQTLAGVAVSLLSLPTTANTVIRGPVTSSPEFSAAINSIAQAIQAGQIGDIQQLMITQTYSPESTSISELIRLAQQEFRIATKLTGISFPVDPKTLLADSSSAFGSYSTSFMVNETTVTWQAMARIGGEPAAPVSALHLSGSLGVLQMNAGNANYQLVKLNGQVIQNLASQSISL